MHTLACIILQHPNLTCITLPGVYIITLPNPLCMLLSKNKGRATWNLCRTDLHVGQCWGSTGDGIISPSTSSVPVDKKDRAPLRKILCWVWESKKGVFLHESPIGELALEDFVWDELNRVDSSSRLSGQYSDSISCSIWRICLHAWWQSIQYRLRLTTETTPYSFSCIGVQTQTILRSRPIGNTPWKPVFSKDHTPDQQNETYFYISMGGGNCLHAWIYNHSKDEISNWIFQILQQ